MSILNDLTTDNLNYLLPFTMKIPYFGPWNSQKGLHFILKMWVLTAIRNLVCKKSKKKKLFFFFAFLNRIRKYHFKRRLFNVLLFNFKRTNGHQRMRYRSIIEKVVLKCMTWHEDFFQFIMKERNFLYRYNIDCIQ